MTRIKPRVTTFSVRLRTELIVSFMSMSLVIMLVFALVMYGRVEKIVEAQSYQNDVRQFAQLEYNILSFSNEVDKISRLLVMSGEVQNYILSNETDDLARFMLIKDIFRSFAQMLGNYEYMDSVCCYFENGDILAVKLRANYQGFDPDKEGFFYTSPMYAKTKADSALHWFGGYMSTDFDILQLSTASSVTTPIHYITATRTIYSTGAPVGVIVINIDESYFGAIYESRPGESERQTYLTDDEGIIVSHADKELIGTLSPYAAQMDEQTDVGSFAWQEEGKQITLYRLSQLPWNVLAEIPLAVLHKDINQLKNVLMILFAISAAAAFLLSSYWLYRITRPLDKLRNAMNEMENGVLGNMLEETSRNELGHLGRQFNKMSKSMMELIDRIKEIEAEKTRLQQDALRAQINPHFLYNTLNTIKYMAFMVQADNIVESITSLGRLLRLLYKSDGTDCTLGEELEYAAHYIQIMNYRFGGGITFLTEVEEDLLEYRLQRFTLQPLIENAILHGFAHQGGKGEIFIAAEAENRVLSIYVSDNGCGIPDAVGAALNGYFTGETAEAPTKGIGLVNVHERIQLYYGNTYGLRIVETSEAGAVVTIVLPCVAPA